MFGKDQAGQNVWEQGKTKGKTSYKEQNQLCFLFNSNRGFLQASRFIDFYMDFTNSSLYNNIPTRQFYSLLWFTFGKNVFCWDKLFWFHN